MQEATAEPQQAAGPQMGLIASLDIGLPSRIAIGGGNAFAIAGYSYHTEDRTRALAIDVGGERTDAVHIGMPRADVLESVEKEFSSSAGRDSFGAFAYRSGFVAIPRLSPRATSAEVEVRLVATLAKGGEADLPLGRVRLDPSVQAPAATTPSFPQAPGPRVAICMATYNPPPALLRRQIESLRAQTHANWICVISDDHSRSDRLAELVEAVGGDQRFLISASDRRLGFYRNFERALALVPATAELVSLCDQDDRWNPDKLERLVERMAPGVELAYSDARVVDARGEMIEPSYWTARPTNYTNFASLLIANTVPGSASLFRRALLDDLLPFPPRLGNPFHDHWLSLMALARGRIAYLDDPLYDYVQHGDAVIGHASANREPHRMPRRALDRVRRRGRGAPEVYYYAWTQQRLFAEVLSLRCEHRMSGQKRRALRRFASADTSVAGLAWLLARRVRRLWGQRETMDVEAPLAKGILWRRAIGLTAARHHPLRWSRRDAPVPPAPVAEHPGEEVEREEASRLR